MPWKEVSVMSQRLEFVQMASSEQANIRQLCRHFNISAPTAYKWLYRFRSGQQQNLLDRSRRPHHSPRRTAAEIERLVVELRTAQPAWGGRKIHARMIALGHPEVPQPSTITAILARHQLIEPSASAKHQSFCRFEHPRPNDLWQMTSRATLPWMMVVAFHLLFLMTTHVLRSASWPVRGPQPYRHKLRYGRCSGVMVCPPE